MQRFPCFTLKHHKGQINWSYNFMFLLDHSIIVLINKQIQLSQLALQSSLQRRKNLTSAVAAKQFLHSKLRTFSNRNFSIVLESLQGKLTFSFSPEQIVFSITKLKELFWLMTSASELPFAFLGRCLLCFHTTRISYTLCEI